MTRERLREVVARSFSSFLRELAGIVPVFLNVVIGTFDENHVFPEDIMMEKNELLVALHLSRGYYRCGWD